jgi:hypothetical protein
MNWRLDFDQFGERCPPHYGVLVLISLLVGSVPLAVYFLLAWPGQHEHGGRAGPATVLSPLPDGLLLDRRTQIAFGAVFAISAVAWAAHRLLPWSPVMAAVSFTGVVALYVENATQLTHVAHLTNALLVLYALWYWTCRDDIAVALRGRRFWRSPLYPRWVYSCSVFAVGYFYGISGLMKWLTSGPGWANGTSLQIWAQVFPRDPQSIWTELVVSHRELARAMQWAALFGETAGFLAIVSRLLRPWVGLLLIAFHFGQILLFGWGFHANAVILALVFLPIYEWFAYRSERRDTPAVREESPPAPAAVT